MLLIFYSICTKLGSNRRQKDKEHCTRQNHRTNEAGIILFLFLSEYFHYLGQVYSRNPNKRQQTLDILSHLKSS